MTKQDIEQRIADARTHYEDGLITEAEMKARITALQNRMKMIAFANDLPEIK